MSQADKWLGWARSKMAAQKAKREKEAEKGGGYELRYEAAEVKGITYLVPCRKRRGQQKEGGKQ